MARSIAKKTHEINLKNYGWPEGVDAAAALELIKDIINEAVRENMIKAKTTLGLQYRILQFFKTLIEENRDLRAALDCNGLSHMPNAVVFWYEKCTAILIGGPILYRVNMHNGLFKTLKGNERYLWEVLLMSRNNTVETNELGLEPGETCLGLLKQSELAHISYKHIGKYLKKLMKKSMVFDTGKTVEKGKYKGSKIYKVLAYPHEFWDETEVENWGSLEYQAKAVSKMEVKNLVKRESSIS